MRVAICEDEEIQQAELESMLNSISHSFSIEKYLSGESLVDDYENDKRFDVILLDMQMKELDGIETAKAIRSFDEKCIIVIITSLLEYAVDGYGVNAFDFILKPVNKMKFQNVMEKAINLIRKAENSTYIVEERDKTSIIKTSDIMYLESNGRKVIVKCDDATIINNENITAAEKKLGSSGFVRISRYFLVNMSYINEINGKYVVLKNSEELPLSRKSSGDIKKEYMNFMMEDMK